MSKSTIRTDIMVITNNRISKNKPVGFYGKKGVFYVYIASLIVLVILILFSVYNSYKFSDQQKVVETRVTAINDFIKDIDFDSKRVIYVSGFRSLIAIEDYVSKTGKYLNNSEELFRIVFYNGTVNGTQVDVLQNSSYVDYLDKLRDLSQRIGIDVFLNVTSITLYQDSPWSVNVVVTAQVYVNDSRGLAEWSFFKNYTTEIPLQNIRDPVYSIGTFGKVPNTIRRTNVSASDFVIDATNDTYDLQIHNNNTYYYENTKAPSFLMRLAGNFSSSPYGIESMVYVPELDVQGVAYDPTKSVIDYVFFTNITGYSECVKNVDNMPDWFRLDTNHTSTYEVNKLSSTPC